MDNYSSDLFANKELKITATSIPGMLVIDLVVHGDERGWFKENFQREKLVALGFPADFAVIQNNISSNKDLGVTRGIHAEPWNKYISLSRGKVFVAIVDLRKGESFGRIETLELTPAKAIYVPKGCGNSYQALSNDVEYSYLVDDHWSADAKYQSVNIADETLSINWPIPLSEATVSEKDLTNPAFKDITGMEF